MVLSNPFHGNNEAAPSDAAGDIVGRVRPAAVAGSFYPADSTDLRRLIKRQLDYGRKLVAQLEPLLPPGAPKAVIVPHAGYVYSGTTTALAYALLERGRGLIRRAVIIGPTHRVAVRGIACSTATEFETPLGRVPVDISAECAALGLPDSAVLRSGMHARAGAPAPAMIVNDPTHMQEHAVEVQIPFLQTALGPNLSIVPLNAGDATPDEVGDVLRALWAGTETVIVISSDLSHYHPQEVARALDEQTIADILALAMPIRSRRACGAYSINGLLDVLQTRRDMRLFELGRSTSGDDGEVALAGRPRGAMRDANEPVVGYASFAAWESVGFGESAKPRESTDSGDVAGAGKSADMEENASVRIEADPESDVEPNESSRGMVLLRLARAAIRERLGLHDGPDGSAGSVDSAGEGLSDSCPAVDSGANMGVDSDVGVDSGANMGTDDSVARLLASYPWLDRPGASFVTLRENGRLRGCIGSLAAYRPLGEDVAAHAVDAAIRDPRFRPVSAAEYPLLDVEISVLGEPEPITISSAQAGDMQDVRARDARDMQDARARDARDARAARDVRDTQNAGTQSARADESRADDVRPVRSRAELESALQPGRDGLILDNGRGSRATFLPQVWDELPDAHDFVSHLLAKAGLPASYDWNDGQIDCQRYTVMAYGEQ